jgi:NADH-quinone oxidoreductase subunit J
MGSNPIASEARRERRREEEMEGRVGTGRSRRRIGAAWRVVRAANPVHSVLYLVRVFVSATGRRRLAEAEFRARLRRVVYVGAIAVLFLFVVMMLNLSGGSRGEEGYSQRQRGMMWGRRGGMRLVVRGAHGGRTERPKERKGEGRTVWVEARDRVSNRQGFGQYLYQDGLRYVVLAGVVLLVARVGSVVLTLKVRTEARAKRQQVYQQRARDADAALVRVKR